MNEKGHEESDEEYIKYVDDDEDNNKGVRTFEVGNNYITGDKINTNEDAIRINEDDISKEKGGIMNSNTSHRDNIERSTKAKYSSRNSSSYSTTGNYKRIVSKEARLRSVSYTHLTLPTI